MDAIVTFFYNLVDLSFTDSMQLILRSVYLLLLGLLIFLLLFRVLSKTLFKKDNLSSGSYSRDDTLTVTFLWALGGLMLLFNIYWVIILISNGGVEGILTKEWYSLLPPVLLYLSLVSLFLFRFIRFRSSLK